MKKPTVIGIDFGTSGCRAVALDLAGKPVGEARFALPAPVRRGREIEQSPLLWAEALERLLDVLFSRISATAVRAIALDGTSGTVLLADAEGTPLTPALMYNDNRAVGEAARIATLAPRHSAAHGTGSGLAKLLWLLAHHALPPGARLHSQADWLGARLSGRFGLSDANNMLKLGYDPVAGCWPAWMEQLGLPEGLLPRVLRPGTPLGPLRPELAARWGLPQETLVCAGTTDSTAAFIASGAGEPGEAVTSLGSTLVLKVISDTPVFAPEFGVYSQPIARISPRPPTAAADPLVVTRRTPSCRLDVASTAPAPSSGPCAPSQRRLDALVTNSGEISGLGNLWLVGGGSNSGGAVLRHFFSDAEMARLSAALQPERPSGLDYYPLLCPGERFPRNDPALPPRLEPRPADDARFFQGLLEGIARIEKEGYERLAELGAPYPVSVRSNGGGASNAAWTRIRGALLGVPMLPAREEQACYGSALLALRCLQAAAECRI
jgi:sugar (pentulose or hexulose) kinase